MKDYKTKEFFTNAEIPHDYYFAVLRALTPANEFGGRSCPDMGTMTWNDVINLENAFTRMQGGEYQAMADVFRICYGTTDDEFFGASIFDTYKALNWVTDTLKRLKEIEAANLAYEPTGEELEAGIGNLSRFGKGALIDSLAGGDILKWEAVVNKTYNEIFFKLCLDKTKTDIERELVKIRSQK